MKTFPPQTDAYTPRAVDSTRLADHPDTRSPTRFLFWVLRSQAAMVASNAFFGLLWFLPGALSPWLMGRAIDGAVLTGDLRAATGWAAALLFVITVGVAAGIAMHTTAVAGWLIALFRTTMLVVRKSAQLGHLLPLRTPTGEVLSVSGSDSDTFGMLTEVVGRCVAALIAFVFVAFLVLSESVQLGLVTLVAAPILVGAASPLLRPLQRAQAIERNRSSKLTGQATDIVAGLRILRGIGGERTFGDNYAQQSQRVRQAGVLAGSWQAVVDSLGVLLSGMLLVILTWLGARQLLAGSLTVGQLISFFGYAIFMVWPIATFFEMAQKWVQADVSARKTIAVLEQAPPWMPASEPTALPHSAEIYDHESGVRIQPGRMTVIVSALPDQSAALADRLGRYLSTIGEVVSTDIDEELKGRAARAERAERLRRRAEQMVRDAVRASQQWGVEVGGVDLAQVDLLELRSRILVNDTASLVFSGTLQELLDPHHRHTREAAEQALRTADAEDVYDALPGGWQGRVDERGRGLSGGQRQRVVLARALLADPEVLVLVEPTSAVDAHTEARIAERLADHRRGRTTIIMSVSALLLRVADDVVLLRDGMAVAGGRHGDLLSNNREYRRIVARGLDDECESGGDDGVRRGAPRGG